MTGLQIYQKISHRLLIITFISVLCSFFFFTEVADSLWVRDLGLENDPFQWLFVSPTTKHLLCSQHSEINKIHWAGVLLLKAFVRQDVTFVWHMYKTVSFLNVRGQLGDFVAFYLCSEIFCMQPMLHYEKYIKVTKRIKYKAGKLVCTGKHVKSKYILRQC